MLETLQRFVEVLRSRGLAISPAEALDAARAAAAVGPEDRRLFRAALSTALAKSLRSRGTFEVAFDEFFAPPARGGKRAGQDTAGGSGGAGGRGRGSTPGGDPSLSRVDSTSGAKRPRQGLMPPGGRTGRSSGLRALRPAEILRELAKAAGSESRRPATGRARGAPRSGAPSPGSADHSARAGGKGKLEPARPRSRLGKVLVEDRTAGVGRAAPDADDPRRTPLRGPLTSEQEQSLAEEAARIIERFRLRRARRLRRAPRGRLWMKRAIRENLATGGVPFKIPRQAPRRKKPRVVLVVDVSWSVARAAHLFVAMTLELLRPGRRASVFFFVDHPVEVTDRLRRRWLRGRTQPLGSAGSTRGTPDTSAWVRPGAGRSRGSPRGTRVDPQAVLAEAVRSYAEVIGSIPDLNPDAASDYGRVFYALASGPLRSLARDSLLLVLGDGRTNVYDPLPWAFEEIASRARRVLWLVPEPRTRWGTGDSSLPRYLASCDVVVETTDLEGLERGVRELLASI